MSIQVCRACLAHNTLMYTIANSPLLRFYEKITDLSLNTEDGRPSVVCYICYHILKKCHRFTQSAIKADEVLQQICKSGKEITEQNISMTDIRPLFTWEMSLVTHFDIIKPVNEIESQKEDAPSIEDVKIETGLDIKDEEDRWSQEDSMPLQVLRSSDSDYEDPDVPLESISIKQEIGDVEKESVSGIFVQEIQGAPVLKRRLMQTTNSPEKQEIQDLVAESSKANHSGVGNKQSYLKKTMYCRTHTEKLFTCNYCERKFTHTSNLTVHLRTHTGEQPYKCKYCEKTFSRTSNLSSHLRIHTGEKPFTCNYCDKHFTQASHLSVHLRIHTGEKPFSCNYCGKKFTNSSNLSLHLRTHTGEKPFPCNYCDKKFNQSSALIVHLRTHAREKPYASD